MEHTTGTSQVFSKQFRVQERAKCTFSVLGWTGESPHASVMTAAFGPSPLLVFGVSSCGKLAWDTSLSLFWGGNILIALGLA